MIALLDYATTRALRGNGTGHPVGILNGPLNAERPARVERAVNRARKVGDSEPPKSWYRIAVEDKADSGKSAEVYLYNEIGYWGVTAADFIDELNEVASDAKTILLRINSPGGDVFDGIAIGNALRTHPAHVTSQIDSLAASAASFIAAMASDHVVMGAYSQMMIHDASGMAIGNAGDMRQMADLLDRVSDGIAQMYADKAGGSRAFWRDRMRDETWYDGPEAVAAGLADEALAPESDDDEEGGGNASNHFDLSTFAYAGRQSAPPPKALKDAPEEQQEPEPPLQVPPLDPDWFRAMMADAVKVADPLPAPDPDIIKAGIRLAFEDAPVPEAPKQKEDPKEEQGGFTVPPIDPTLFYNAIREALS